jgi:3-phenylpropionate/cinnamic acid dioxygenase small subunit
MSLDEKALERTLDRLAIEDLLVRYCTIVDTREFDRFDEIFTPDAVIDYTNAGGIRGTLAEIKAWLKVALQPFVVVQHMVSNFDIRVDGDRATATCYLFNPMGLGSPGRDATLFWCGGRYRDQLVRASSGWRIQSRTNELLYMHGAPQGVRTKT